MFVKRNKKQSTDGESLGLLKKDYKNATTDINIPSACCVFYQAHLI